MKNLRALSLALATAACLGASPAALAQGVRAEVGRPLQHAAELLRAGKAKEALARVREADAVPGKTAAEQLVIDRMKAAAAQRAGDMATAISALEGIYAHVGGSEQGQIAEQIAAAYAQQRNNGRAGEWLAKAVAAGNNSANVRQLQSYLQASSGDYAAIARESGAAVAAAEQAGRRPEEGDLLRLADAQQRTNNSSAYFATLGKLVAYYPKKDYWAAYLARLPRKPGFADRYALDVLRLRLATGTLDKTDDYMEMAQLALQARLPAESLRIIEQGYKSGALGTGPEAARHQRLRDLALKREAESKAALPAQVADAEADPEGDALVTVGTVYASMGDAEKAVALIQKGLAKDKLKHPEEARLRLGQAQMQSPKMRSAGVQTLRGVKGTDGVADIARLWVTAGASS